MIKKILIRNIGVLKTFDTPASPQLARITTIYARNGRGKTTLSTVLRSASLGKSDLIKGRQTLGNGNAAPEVTLFYSDRHTRFKEGNWTEKSPHIDVFDAAFIAENLYAGEAIDLLHDRSLFTIILGREGVRLARQQEFFNIVAKRTAVKLKNAESALSDDIPSDNTREEFFAFSPGPSLDIEIAKAESDLKVIQQSDRLSRLKPLASMSQLILSDDFRELLARTVPHIESSVRESLADHFKKFHLGKRGEAWIRFGLEHIENDQCPFCGHEGVDDQELITLYGKIFGKAYQAHLDLIKTVSERIEQTFGAETRSKLVHIATTNAEVAHTWSEFYDLGEALLPDVSSVIAKLDSTHEQLAKLFEIKRQSPLSAIENDQAITAAAQTMAEVINDITSYNTIVASIQSIIIAANRSSSLSEAQAILRLQNLRRRKRRSDPGVQKRIQIHLSCKRQDVRAKFVRTEVQSRLKIANEASALHFHNRVNHYLQFFGATFIISPITNSMTGNAGSVDYGLVVRGHHVGRGRGKLSADEPTFKNTLSTGDKTTLALAFFLAKLDREKDLPHRIIVFDDPLSSHDRHREIKTVELLSQLSLRCAQMIVLSHNEHFLRRMVQWCTISDKVCYELNFDGAELWSKARVADLDELCQSDDALQRRNLKSFFHERKGETTIVAPAVRKVLETHYRSTFPIYFGRNDNLGHIIRLIRDGGPSHPCSADLRVLDACNEATKDEHHGDDPTMVSTAPIDPDALHLIVADCLRLINEVKRVA